MTQFTNRQNLPAPLAKALSANKYSRGDARASATTLIGSPRMAILKEKHGGEATLDVVDRLWAVFGTAVHQIIEEGAEGMEDYIPEERIFTEIDGWVISGAIDVQHHKDRSVTIIDWKTCSTFAVMNGKEDWVRQQNIYAYLLRKERGLKVAGIKIGAIMKDWRRAEAQRKPDYPQSPIVMIDLPVWPFEVQERYLKDRVALHKDAHRMHEWGEELPECTPEEMWERGSTWAVKKPGGKRAVSVHKTEEAAIGALQGDQTFEHRPGERIRCESYCEAAAFCSQHQRYLSYVSTPDI